MMNELLSQIPQIDPQWSWIISVFIVVLATVIGNFTARKLLIKLVAKLSKTRTLWDDALIQAASKPLTWLIWIIGIAFAADIIHAKTQAPVFLLTDSIRQIGILMTLTWFILRFIKEAESILVSKEGGAIDRHTSEAVAKLIRMAIIITAILVTLQTLGYSISGLLAFGGVGGIAIGFAAKDLLANFFGGLIIYLDRPFRVGDWIRSPDKKLEGTVEKIGWRMTQIRTFDKRPLYVPNSVFTSIIVENPSRMSNRRIYETIGIRYDDISQMDKIIEDVKRMLKTHEEIDTRQTMIVNFNEFAASSVDFFVYTFTKTSDWVKFHQIKQDVLLKIAGIIEHNKAEIAFPTTTVLLPESTNN